jgi:glycosyltransferase involved in cell wall biosynthesis
MNIPDGKSLKPLRVLHVLEATAGGTMRYMEDIGAATEGLDIDFGFAYGFERADSKLEPFLEKVRKRGWQTFRVDMRREIDPMQDMTAFAQMCRAVRSFAPDIIHCHSSKAGALGRAAATTLFPSPIRIYSPHALAVGLGSKYLKIEKMLAGFTERFSAVSESEREEILGLSLAKAGEVDVVYPLVDCEHFRPASREAARAKLGLAPGPIVLAIGRVTKQKNPEAFVNILKRLHTACPEVRGIWVGARPGDPHMPDFVAAEGMEKVITVMDWVPDVRDYMAAADVVLMTSRFESFGYVTAEALAMQTPVVASNVTGTRDIMRDEMRQWLYKDGDHEYAAQLVMQLLRYPDRAREVALAGREIVLRCFGRPAAMRDALLQVYTSALKNAGRHGVNFGKPRRGDFPAGNSIPAEILTYGAGSEAVRQSRGSVVS